MHPLDILFWVCLFIGGGYFLVSLLLGGISGSGHHDFGAAHTAGELGDAGGHAIDAHADMGDASGHDLGDHGADGSHGGFNPLSLLSPMALAGLLFGFGCTALVSRWLGRGLNPSLLFGSVGGFSTWLAAHLFLRQIVTKGQSTSHHQRERLVGCRAQVTTPIDGSHPGMVSFVASGARQSIMAVSDEEEPIPAGTAVRIRRIEDNKAHVVRIHLS